MRNIFILIVFLLATSATHAQHRSYVAGGELLVDEIVETLQSYESGSAEQDAIVIQVINSLLRERLGSSEMVYSSKFNSHIDHTLQNLIAKRAQFHFLNPLPFRYDPSGSYDQSFYRSADDTLSSEIIELEDKWEAFSDSLSIIYDEFKIIVENSKANTRATKERAANLLGRSPRTRDILYIFENGDNLGFGIHYMECWSCERSGMYGLINTSNFVDKPINYWRHFPYFIEYWGDPDWQDQSTQAPLEFLIFYNMLYEYKHPELIFQFIQANSKDPYSPILNSINKILEYKNWEE